MGIYQSSGAELVTYTTGQKIEVGKIYIMLLIKVFYVHQTALINNIVKTVKHYLNKYFLLLMLTLVYFKA